MRQDGYFVDLDPKTIQQIKNFKISFNRHEGKYRILSPNYNYASYNTKYYYADQNINLFYGDPDVLNKAWRRRTNVKRKIFTIVFIMLFIWVHYKYNLKQHRLKRQWNIKNNENKKNNNINNNS